MPPRNEKIRITTILTILLMAFMIVPMFNGLIKASALTYSWSGTISGHSSISEGGVTASGSDSGKFSFTIGDSGQIVGSGSVTESDTSSDTDCDPVSFSGSTSLQLSGTITGQTANIIMGASSTSFPSSVEETCTFAGITESYTVPVKPIGSTSGGSIQFSIMLTVGQTYVLSTPYGSSTFTLTSGDGFPLLAPLLQVQGASGSTELTNALTGTQQPVSSGIQAGDVLQTGAGIIGATGVSGQSDDIAPNSNVFFLDLYAEQTPTGTPTWIPDPPLNNLNSQTQADLMNSVCTSADTYNGACVSGAGGTPTWQDVGEAVLTAALIVAAGECVYSGVSPAGCSGFVVDAIFEGKMSVETVPTNLPPLPSPPNKINDIDNDQQLITVPQGGVFDPAGTIYTVGVENGTTIIQVFRGSATFFDPVTNDTATITANQTLTLPPAPVGGFSNATLKADTSSFNPSTTPQWWSNSTTSATTGITSDITCPNGQNRHHMFYN